MNDLDKITMNELILRSLEEEVSAEEFALLDRYLKSAPENQVYYEEMIDFYVELDEGPELIVASSEVADPVLQEQWWESLAEDERNAPAKVMEGDDALEPIRIDRSQLLRPRRRLERTSLYSVVAAIAALIFLLVYVRFVPPRKVAEPVATLTDSIRAQWANASVEMVEGVRISSDQGAIILTKGVAEFLCDDQTKITIEAPSEFEFLRSNQVALNYGRLYAVSSKGSAGFTVDTPSSRIVDLGTEFGVRVDVNGATEVHMISGMASLLLKDDTNDVKTDVVLKENQARRVQAKGTAFKELAFRAMEFVRTIDSGENLIWRGEPINLADIVGGGNGFGTGVIGSAVDPLTGESFMLKDVADWNPREGHSYYVPVTWHDFIDGVFVPDSDAGPVAIATDGRQFTSFSDTCRMAWAGVTNGGRLPEPLGEPAQELWFNGLQYGNSRHPGIFMHSNLGITFDLEAIRKAYPNITLTEFRSQCGICDNGPGRLPYADFWVLVDGQLRFNENGVKANERYEIAIPISSTDRFLTLATTDGGLDVCWLLEDGTPVPIDSDWCLFADPYLMVKEKE